MRRKLILHYLLVVTVRSLTVDQDRAKTISLNFNNSNERPHLKGLRIDKINSVSPNLGKENKKYSDPSTELKKDQEDDANLATLEAFEAAKIDLDDVRQNATIEEMKLDKLKKMDDEKLEEKKSMLEAIKSKRETEKEQKLKELEKLKLQDSKVKTLETEVKNDMDLADISTEQIELQNSLAEKEAIDKLKNTLESEKQADEKKIKEEKKESVKASESPSKSENGNVKVGKAQVELETESVKLGESPVMPENDQTSSSKKKNEPENSCDKKNKTDNSTCEQKQNACCNKCEESKSCDSDHCTKDCGLISHPDDVQSEINDIDKLFKT